MNINNENTWELEHPHEMVHLKRDFPKFNEATITGVSCLDALQLWCFSQFKESDLENFICQQDGVPPHRLAQYPFS